MTLKTTHPDIPKGRRVDVVQKHPGQERTGDYKLIWSHLTDYDELQMGAQIHIQI